MSHGVSKPRLLDVKLQGYMDFAHMGSGKVGPQTSPFTPTKERYSETETVGEGSLWYLPGVCG